MARSDWVLGGDRRAAATDRIYAAATELILRDGIDSLDIDALAARVHCSRATIYRYAGGKAQIRDAVLTRVASGIIDTVRKAVDGLSGPERVVTAITMALNEIRSSPIRRPMLKATSAPELGELHTSPALSRLAADLSGLAGEDPRAGQWVVRVVLSLAYWPLADAQAEREVLERFVAPAFGA